MPVAKKTTPAKKKTVARKPAAKRTAPPAKKAVPAAPVKRGPGRPRKVVTSETPVETVSQNPEGYRYTERDANRQVQGIKYKELADMLGVGISSERLIVAVELLKGGLDRQEVNNRLAEILPSTTRNGTKKSVSNLVSSALAALVELGFEVKGNWKVVKPASSK